MQQEFQKVHSRVQSGNVYYLTKIVCISYIYIIYQLFTPVTKNGKYRSGKYQRRDYRKLLKIQDPNTTKYKWLLLPLIEKCSQNTLNRK